MRTPDRTLLGTGGHGAVEGRGDGWGDAGQGMGWKTPTQLWNEVGVARRKSVR